MKRVLITGGGGSATEALFRLLDDRYEVFFADAETEAFPPLIPDQRRVIIPWATESTFASEMMRIVRDLRIDILIPTVDEELHHVWSIVAQLPDLAVIAPPPDFIALTLDKLKLMQELAARNLDAPRTVSIDEIDRVGFPAFVKPRSGRGSRGARVISDKREAEAYMTLANVPVDDIIAQEMLTGQEYSVMVAARPDGSLGAVVPVRIDLKRGVTIRGVTDADDRVLAYCRALHGEFGVSGVYNIQLMKDADGRVLPFEINPRISTTTCLAIAAGVDPIAITTAHESALGDVTSFRPGVKLARTWYNAISDGVL